MKPDSSVGWREKLAWLETNLKIRSKDQGMIPWRLNKVQREYLQQDDPKKIVLKARQIGMTTVALADIYYRTINQTGTLSVIVAQQTSAAEQFLEIIKGFYDQTPEGERPVADKNNAGELSFPGINSKIMVLSPTKNAGRGLTIQNLLCSEVAFWPHEQTLTALLEAVTPQGRITLESTPNGVGNLYHQLWEEANNGGNGYTPLSYDWRWGYDEEWAKQRKAEIGASKWGQEYDCDFLQSGRPVYEWEILEEYVEGLVEGEGRQRIYRAPQRWSEYVIGVDTAQGLANGDYSAAVVLEVESGEEVACLHGHWPVEEWAKRVAALGQKYNRAELIVEENNHGHSVLMKLRQLGYDEVTAHQTNVRTKTILIDRLGEHLRQGTLTLRTPELLEELKAYQYLDNGSTSAPSRMHDDRVIALALAVVGQHQASRQIVNI